MPLARGPDGKLGVRSGSGGATSVTVNISTPDAESFRRSEAQVSAALARAVGRGRRASREVPMPADFHEVRFPLDTAIGSRGGPVRRTEVVTLASGREHRNGRWADSRRRYDAGLGVRTVDGLHAVLAFFEERRGRLYGFRFHDRVDCKSCAPSATPGAGDVPIGTGDGTRTTFQLVKRYGSAFAPYDRTISKPVAGSVRIAVGGTEMTLGAAVSCDASSGLVTFTAPPSAGTVITAGFALDVPVRFDTDELEFDLSALEAGAIPSIPLVEIIP